MITTIIFDDIYIVNSPVFQTSVTASYQPSVTLHVPSRISNSPEDSKPSHQLLKPLRILVFNRVLTLSWAATTTSIGSRRALRNGRDTI